VIGKLLRATRGVCGALVLVFSARRLLLLAASYRTSAEPASGDETLPSLAIVVPCRNEARSVDRLLESLADTAYPADRLAVVLVDDGSNDGTGELLERWAAAGERRHAIRAAGGVGKVGALEAGLTAVDGAELIAVCDADQRPRPDCWRRLVLSFGDDRVGAIAGFLAPANHDASIVSRYAALESWVHQLVTSEGKDRLGLNPPTLGGGSVYRRAALDDVGGFVAGISGEDVTTSVALTEAGWTTRFVRGAVVENDVVSGWDNYWHQHVRWARGTLGTTGEHRRHSPAPVGRRLESWVVSSGYLDRLAFLGTLVLPGGRSRTLPALYALAAGLEVCVALARGGVPVRTAPRYLAALVVVFPVDIAATAAAVVSHLRRRPLTWQSPR
jgi:1,2-diacylglycerol 3-beta-glucosyltransferase